MPIAVKVSQLRVMVLNHYPTPGNPSSRSTQNLGPAPTDKASKELTQGRGAVQSGSSMPSRKLTHRASTKRRSERRLR